MQKLNLPIHHIGVATQSIQQEWVIFDKLGFVVEDEFVDEIQGVRGVFITSQQPNPFYRLELLENLNPQGPLTNYLQHRTKMYHIAYETQSIQKDMQLLKDKSMGWRGGV